MKHIRHLKNLSPCKKVYYIIRVLLFLIISKYKYHDFSKNADFCEKIKDFGLN